MPWKQLSSKSVYKDRYMEVTEDRVQTPSGDKLTFGIVRKKPFALIIPWNGKRLTLVGQYRYAVRHFSWEFPAGHLEHGSIKETARAELKEETGLSAATIRQIAVLDLAPGHCTQQFHVFFATKLTHGTPARERSEKGMKVKKVTPKEFAGMATGGKITDGPSLAAWGVVKELGLLK
jgi:8-oxo-dGTP pyrophosphatase MutT (NUDIX family)